jgi:hypothetical protein
VELHELGQVHVREAVAVREAEVLSPEVVLHALQSPAGLRLLAGVDQRHLPRLGVTVVDLDAVLREVDGHVGRVDEVVREVLLDDVALVAQADDELVDPMRRVDLHQVPQDRLAADLDHGLGFQVGLLGEPRPEPAREYDGLHHRAPRYRWRALASGVAAASSARDGNGGSGRSPDLRQGSGALGPMR